MSYTWRSVRTVTPGPDLARERSGVSEDSDQSGPELGEREEPAVRIPRLVGRMCHRCFKGEDDLGDR